MSIVGKILLRFGGLCLNPPKHRHGLGVDLAYAALASSTRFIEPDATAWPNNTVRVMARNISPATFDLGAAMSSVEVRKRLTP